jgi:hypothetical protein
MTTLRGYHIATLDCMVLKVRELDFVRIDVHNVLFVKSDNFGLKVTTIIKFRDIVHIIQP